MHGLADRQQNLEFRQADRFKDNGQIGTDIDQRLFRRGAVADQDVEGNGRMILSVGRNLFRQEIGDKRLAAGDGDVPPAFPAEIRNLAFHPLDIAELAADMVDQDFTCSRQTHAPGEALEYFHAEIFLDRQNPAVQCR